MEPISPSLLVPDIQPASNTPKLKPLPDNLKYAYLEEEEKFSVIISTSLTAEQEQRLLHVLKKHKRQLDGHWLTFLVLAHQHAWIGYCWKMEQS